MFSNRIFIDLAGSVALPHSIKIILFACCQVLPSVILAGSSLAPRWLVLVQKPLSHNRAKCMLCKVDAFLLNYFVKISYCQNWSKPLPHPAGMGLFIFIFLLACAVYHITIKTIIVLACLLVYAHLACNRFVCGHLERFRYFLERITVFTHL